MVGCHNLDLSCDERLPEELCVLFGFDRGVHLDQATESGVVTDMEGPMVWA